MSGARVKSKAQSLPLLEEPEVPRHETNKVSTFISTWIELTGTREGGLSLARLDTTKYVAILAIMLLAASLLTHV